MKKTTPEEEKQEETISKEKELKLGTKENVSMSFKIVTLESTIL